MKLIKIIGTWGFLLVFGLITAMLVLLGANCFIYYKIYTIEGWTWKAVPYALLAFCLVLFPAGLKVSEFIINLGKTEFNDEEFMHDILDSPKTDTNELQENKVSD